MKPPITALAFLLVLALIANMTYAMTSTAVLAVEGMT